MDSAAVQYGMETPEVVRLKRRILAFEEELSQCRAERDAALSAKHPFEVFSEKVKDFAFITFDAEGRITSWSRGAERILGYAEHEALGRPSAMIFTPEDRTNGEVENELATALHEGCAEDDRWHLRRDGTRFWASGVLTAHRESTGALLGFSKVMRDLTMRRQIEERLRESEERLGLFAENVRDYALIPVDTAGNVSGWNPGAGRAFGYAEQEIVGRPVELLFTPEDREGGVSERDLKRAVEEGRSEESRWMVRQDGSRFWARWVTSPMYDSTGRLRGFAKVLQDETQRKEAEDLVAESLQEKEVLLREIHHRVKNNLHVINSLLSLQAAQVENTRFRVVLDELQDRVRAIAALHETLYGSRDLANIDFGPYMQQLVQDLATFHNTERERIDLRTEADDVVLSIEQALPLGLIVNELVSNALKHAFPDQRQGKILVQLRYLQSETIRSSSPDLGWCELSVYDDGVGIADADNIWERKSMGLRIVHLLSRQLNGQLAVDRSGLTRFSMRFPLEEFGFSEARAKSWTQA